MLQNENEIIIPPGRSIRIAYITGNALRAISALSDTDRGFAGRYNHRVVGSSGRGFTGPRFAQRVIPVRFPSMTCMSYLKIQFIKYLTQILLMRQNVKWGHPKKMLIAACCCFHKQHNYIMHNVMGQFGERE